MIRLSVSAAWQLGKLSSRLPHRLGDGGSIFFFNIFTFQRDNSQVFKKDISWVLNLAREDYILKGGREKFCNDKSSKIHALKKGGQGPKVKK